MIGQTEEAMKGEELLIFPPLHLMLAEQRIDRNAGYHIPFPVYHVTSTCSTAFGSKSAPWCGL
jgi:hypothetical protein